MNCLRTDFLDRKLPQEVKNPNISEIANLYNVETLEYARQ